MKFLALIGAGLVLTLAGCGGSSSDRARDTSASAGKTREPTAKTAPRVRSTVMMSKAEIAKLPPLRIPRASEPAPHSFRIVDLREGFGRMARKTDTVSIRYIEDTYPEARKGRQGGLSGGVVRWPTQPLRGVGRSIRHGVPGMKVGGRRELIVPPKVAYPHWKPSWGYAPYVSIYVVDLLGAEP